MNRMTIHKNSKKNSAVRAHSVVIIGAGLNGLAAAYEIRKTGMEPVILDASDTPAAPWRCRHDQLRLNTHRWISHLPGMRIPRRFGAFPSRDDMVRYLEEYEQFLNVDIHRPVRVRRIDPHADGWRLATSDGTRLAGHVIIATGHERVPVIPEWPGRDGFTGELIHAARFGRADRFADKRVLVVGAGNSGMDVLNHLVKIQPERMWVSVRSGPTVLPTRVIGFPLQLLSPMMSLLPACAVDLAMAATERLILGNLRKYGLPKHPDGVATRLLREGVAPAFDDGFVAALKRGEVTVVPEVVRFDRGTVHLADGRTLRPDAVICATGYRPGLEPMAGHLGVLNDAGQPGWSGAEVHPNYEGLWFMGMKPRLPGVFHAARAEARQVARKIKKQEAKGRRRNVVPFPAWSAR